MSDSVSQISVYAYSPAVLRTLIEQATGAPKEILDRKSHLRYFTDYFHEIGARTVIAEQDYVDRHYLEDHSAYYVRCFKRYKRRCVRLHFFSRAFTEREFKKVVVRRSKRITEKSLSRSYLGFVVLKPLPKTFIGRTCLKTYPKKKVRNYPVTQTYLANLVGLRLSVESLAFQEQDNVAAACATSALWSAFHGTSKLFQHAMPSPIEITRQASEHAPHLGRALPNKMGLNPYQLMQAIRRAGLEPEVQGVATGHWLKAMSYAYLRARIPSILIAMLCDTSDPNVAVPYIPEDPTSLHAVAITGYRLSQKPIVDPGTGVLFTSSRISELYVHDDQVGPFARMGFDPNPIRIDLGKETVERPQALTCSWQNRHGVEGVVRFVPETLILPLYHKIRLTYGYIHKKAAELNDNLLVARTVDNSLFSGTLEWDVYLTTVSEFKADLRDPTRSNIDKLYSVLVQPLPRFLWLASASSGSRKLVTFAFDATDIEQGQGLVAIAHHDGEFRQRLLRALGAGQVQVGKR